MHLVRCMFYLEAQYHFDLHAVYLPGAVNTLADDLSRNRRSSFLQKAPEMQWEPVLIPPQIPELLLQGADWTSPRWRETFISSCTEV